MFLPLRCLPLLLAAGLFALPGCTAGDGASAANSTAGDDDRAKTEAKKKHPANQLAKESSPYLLQHAHNPVNWHPWGPAAFAKAKKENKPIFLSIGYSSCYWCHVMEREVFENEEIAKYMNEHFVNVKVDREERPDVDDVYMNSLHIYFQLVGSRQGGGWPLSMFLTPEGKPFAGGTYFPPEDKPGRRGFPTVLKTVQTLWTTKEESIRQNADQLTDVVRRSMKPKPVLKPVKIEDQLVAAAAESLLESYDSEHGGIGYQPGRANASKFPVPAKLAFLQYVAEKSGDRQPRNRKAGKALYHTLDRIAAGGIHDHLGGGFHRYSVDRYWHVPHFEKMLYDQSQLAEVYLRAWQAKKTPAYKEAAEGIFRYVLREMTDAKGGFYSALDAETDGVEGKYYVWSAKEIEQTLGEADAKLFQMVYGFEEEKRFEHGYVLHLPHSLATFAKELKIPLPELKTRLAAMRSKLHAARQKREPLLKDDKVLTSWNGLMIRAFANGGRILDEPKYTKAAERGALFVLENLRDDKGRLQRTWRKGTSKLNAYVDDYAFLVSGLLALHETTGDEKWLNAARRLTDDQIRDYWSKTGGGFFFTPHHHEELIARTRNAYDAVLPSGNAVSVRNLVELAERTGEKKYRKYAQETIEAFGSNLENAPSGMAHMGLAVAEFLAGAQKPEQKPAGDADGKPASNKEPDGKPRKDGTAAATGTTGAPGVDGEKQPVVRAAVYLSVDKLPIGGKCRVVVLIDVKKGWHINANPPESETAVATAVTLRSKAGVKLADLQYPAGRAFRPPGLDETVNVYEGRVAVYGTLIVPQDVGGLEGDELELRVRYQACNDARCLPPKTVKLGANVAFAGAAEVKPVNRRLFDSGQRE